MMLTLKVSFNGQERRTYFPDASKVTFDELRNKVHEDCDVERVRCVRSGVSDIYCLVLLLR